jgi:hypothetical protein
MKLARTPYKGPGQKVGRDAATGRFIPLAVARRRKRTAIVQTIRRRVKR